MNTKQRFQSSEENLLIHRRILDVPGLRQTMETALLVFIESKKASPDLAQHASNWNSIEGAREFIEEFMRLSEVPKKPTRTDFNLGQNVTPT